jgi:hypothetical protein
LKREWNSFIEERQKELVKERGDPVKAEEGAWPDFADGI